MDFLVIFISHVIKRITFQHLPCLQRSRAASAPGEASARTLCPESPQAWALYAALAASLYPECIKPIIGRPGCFEIDPKSIPPEFIKSLKDAPVRLLMLEGVQFITFHVGTLLPPIDRYF